MMSYFQKILDLFKPHYSGIIPDPRSAIEKAHDKVLGSNNALPLIVRISNSDWNRYAAIVESQNVPFIFDTYGCVTFSSGQDIEEQIIWALMEGKVPQGVIDRMKILGFFKNPADYRTFKISKRFSIIMNGTTRDGNYFHKVADTHRNVGFISDTMLPFGDVKTWAAYTDRSLITNDMIRIAREMLSYFEIQYEYAPINTSDGMALNEIALMKKLLQCSPIQIATPVPAHHAQLLQSIDDEYQYIRDSYEPFDLKKKINNPKIDWAMRYLVTPIQTIPVTLARNLYFGMQGDDVARIQRFLHLKDDGIFGKNTKNAVIAFQIANHLTPDGIWGRKSEEKMLSLS